MLSFKSTFESVVSNQKNLESVVYRMKLEQDLIESQLQTIEATVIKIIEEQVEKGYSDQNQAITDKCLHIFSKLKKYDSVLTSTIDDLNREICGTETEENDCEQNINCSINNFYNAVSGIESKLAKIQANLVELK